MEKVLYKSEQEEIITTNAKAYCVICLECGSHNFGILTDSKGVIKCRGRKDGHKCDEFIFVERKANKVHIAHDCIKNYFPERDCIDSDCYCNAKKGSTVYHCCDEDLEEAKEAHERGDIILKLAKKHI